MPCKFFDIDDETNMQENQVQEVDNNINKLEILQQRYGWLRNEIMMNLDHRYKLMQFLMALLPVTYSVIVVSKLYFISFLASILVLIIAVLFYSENKSIVDKSNYLLKLEEYIDSNAELPVSGWEVYARSSEMKKVRATRTLHITFMLLFFISYTVYNVIFCYKFIGNNIDIAILDIFPDILVNWIVICVILEIPMFIFMKVFLVGVSDYFNKK